MAVTSRNGHIPTPPGVCFGSHAFCSQPPSNSSTTTYMRLRNRMLTAASGVVSGKELSQHRKTLHTAKPGTGEGGRKSQLNQRKLDGFGTLAATTAAREHEPPPPTPYMVVTTRAWTFICAESRARWSTCPAINSTRLTVTFVV